VFPSNKPHYCVPGCNFLWKAPGENFNDSGENFNDGKSKVKGKSFKYMEKRKMFEQQKKTKTQLCILTQ